MLSTTTIIALKDSCSAVLRTCSAEVVTDLEITAITVVQLQQTTARDIHCVFCYAATALLDV